MDVAAVKMSDIIVPTPVGVNRCTGLLCEMHIYCPHARGGEPRVQLLVTQKN